MNDATKNILGNTLKELLAEKTLDKITVKEITKKSYVNRQTFYYHFDDILGLTRFLLKREVIELFNPLDETAPWEDGVDIIFDYLEDNKAYVYNAVKSLGNEWIYLFFYEELFVILFNTVKEEYKDLNKTDEELEKITKFLVISLGGYIIAWITGVVEGTYIEVRDFIKEQLLEI